MHAHARSVHYTHSMTVLASLLDQLDLSDEELAERLGHIKRPAHPAPGVLGAYRKAVDSVNEGCTWLYGKEE